MKIRPLEDNLLIKREKVADRTASGILIAVQEQKMEKGLVISCGSAIKDIKKGQQILFKNYSLDIVELDGEELTFIKRENVLAVIG